MSNDKVLFNPRFSQKYEPIPKPTFSKHIDVSQLLAFLPSLLSFQSAISELEYKINFESRNRPIINYELILKSILFLSWNFQNCFHDHELD